MHNRLDLQLTDSLIVNNNFEDILPKLSESPYFFHWWMPFPHTPIRFNRECNLIEQQNWPNSYENNYEEQSNRKNHLKKFINDTDDWKFIYGDDTV